MPSHKTLVGPCLRSSCTWALPPVSALRDERPTLVPRRAGGDLQGEGQLTAKGKPGWVVQAG